MLYNPYSGGEGLEERRASLKREKQLKKHKQTCLKNRANRKNKNKKNK